MILVVLTAVLAVCGAARLDQSYLPPLTAKTAGGSQGALIAPDELPSGSYTNDAQGVVVDAANPGTRTSGPQPTGLGGPRTSYGSTDSKVGNAAFTRIAPGFGSITGVQENAGGPSIRIAPGFSSYIASGGSDKDKTRASTLKFASELGLENYSYGFETDNGIAVGEDGVAEDGVKAHGGYSYKGDDGKVYSVSYTADEGGYRPHGSHLPTPHPIPDEILKSLEQNAKDEAAGIVDDGSYDAEKYNDEGDYSSNSDGNNNRPSVSGGTAGTSFSSHNNQAFLQNGAGHGSVHGFGTHGAHGVFGGHASGNRYTSGSQGGAAGSFSTGSHGHHGHFHGSKFSSHSTQNRFGEESVGSTTGGSSASAIASTGNHQNFRVPVSSSGNSAFSSATSTGTGSASAFASTGPVGPGGETEFNRGLAGQGSSGTKPGSATFTGAQFSSLSTAQPSGPSAVASAEGQNAAAQASSSNDGFNFGVPTSTQKPLGTITQKHNSGTTVVTITESTSPVQGSSSSSTFGSNNTPTPSVQTSPINLFIEGLGGRPTKVPATESTTSFQQNGVPNNERPGFSLAAGFNDGLSSSTTSQPSFQGSQSGSRFQTENGEANPQSGTNQVNFGSSTPKPNQQFLTPITQFQPARLPALGSGSSGASGQVTDRPSNVPVGSVIQGNQFSNTPISSVDPTASTPSGQFQGSTVSSFINGLTQATISPFPSPSPSPTPSSQFGSQPDRFGSTTTQFGQQSSQTQFGTSGQPVTQFGQKPIVQSQIGQTENTQSQGTIYEYNKPASQLETTSAHVSSSQTGSQAVAGQSSFGSQGTQFGGQQTKPFGNAGTGSAFQQNQYQGSTFGSQSTNQFGQKPTQVTESSITFVDQPDQTHYGQKPFGSAQNGYQQAQFGSTSSPQLGNKHSGQSGSTFEQTQFGSSGSQFSQTGSSQSSTQENQGTLYEYNKPETVTTQKETFSTSSGTFSQGNNAGQNTQFGSRPFGSSQTGSTFQQTQFGSNSGSQFGQKPQTVGTAPQVIPISQFGSQSSHGSFQQSQFGSKPQTEQESAYVSSNAQTTQFGTKPSSTGFQQTQFSSSSDSKVGQKPQSVGNVPQVIPISQFSSQTQFGSRPQTSEESTFTSSAGQTTQFGNRPTEQTGSRFQQTQGSQSSSFGSQPSAQFGSKPQTSQTFSSSSQTGSSFQQTQFGSTSGSQYGQTPQSGYVPQVIPISQFGLKPGHSGSQQQTQFGSSSGSQYSSSGSQSGQNAQSEVNGPQVIPITQFGSQSSQGSLQQTQFGSSSGSQFASKPQTNEETAYISSTAQTTQFGKEPSTTTQTGGSFQQTQFSSSSGSKFGQKPLSGNAPQIVPISQFGSQSNQGSLQQSQFGSKPDTNEGSAYISTTGQVTQFGNRPTTSSQSSSTFQQTQTSQESTFGSQPNIQSSQKPYNTEGSRFGNSQTGSTFQQSQFGSSSGPQFGQKPQSVGGAQQGASISQFGSQTSQGSLQQTQFGSTSSQFGSGTTQGSTGQSAVFEKKPTSTTQTGSTFQQTQFGSSSSQFGQKPQSGSQVVPISQFNVQSSQFGQNIQKPSSIGISQTGSTFQQSQFGSSTGSQVQPISEFVKPVSQFGQKPQSGASFASSSVSQGQSQTTQFGQKPFDSTLTTGSNYQSVSFTGALKPETSQGSTPSPGSQSSFGVTPSSVQEYAVTTESRFSENEKPVVSTQFTGSSFSQNQFGSSGPQFGQKPQLNQGSNVQTTQFGVKPFGSSQTSGSSFSQNQFGTSGSQFGQKPQSTQGSTFTSNTGSQSSSFAGSKGQAGQTTQFGVKPISSSQTIGSSFSQSQFGSTTGSQFGQKPVSTQGSSTQSTSYASITPSKGPAIQTVQFGIKPTGTSQPIGSGYTQTQFGSSSGSRFGQGSSSTFNSGSKGPVVQTTQFGLKPTGSSQTTTSSYSQNQFGSASGSQFGTQGSSTGLNTGSKGQGVQTTQFGVKPFGSSQATASSVAQNQFGSSSGSQFGSQGSTYNTGSKGPVVQTTQFGLKPVGSSQTTGSSVSQNQFGSTSGSQFGSTSGSQFASQGAYGNTGIKGQAVQTTTQFGSSLAFGSANTQNQFGSTTGSQFGTQGTSSVSSAGSKGQGVQTTQFGVKPIGSSQATGSSTSQNQFGSTSGSRFGSTSGSQLGTQGTFTGSKGQAAQTTQFGSASGSQFGSQGTSSGFNKGQGVQSTQFGVKPFGSSQTTSSSVSQNQFGSTSGSQFGTQGTSSGFNTGIKGQSVQTTNQFGSPQTSGSGSTQFGSNTGSQFGTQGTKGQGVQSTQFGVKPPGSSQTTGSSLTQNQFGSSSGSQFGTQGTSSSSNTGIKGQTFQTSTQFGVKPISSSFSQSQFSSSSGSKFGQKPSSGSGVGSFAITSGPAKPISQFGKRPFGSQTTQTQFGSTESQFGQTTGPVTQSGEAQFGQTTFGSSQTGSGFQQSQTGSSVGTQFGQKPQPAVGSQTSTSTFSQSSQFATQEMKPFGGQQSGVGATISKFKPHCVACASAAASALSKGKQTGQGSRFQVGYQTSPQDGQTGSQAVAQVGQAVDQNTQSTQTGSQVSSISQASSSVVSGGYGYKKPQPTFSTVTRFSENTQTVNGVTSGVANGSPTTVSPFDYSQSVSSTQFGVQPTQPTNVKGAFSTQTSQSQFGGQSFGPVSTVSTPVVTIGSSQSSIKPYRPNGKPSTQVSFEQLQSALSSKKASQSFGFGSTLSPVSVTTATPDSKYDSSVSIIHTPVTEIETIQVNGNQFAGKGELFGGPRDPPRYDDKTGYHY
ncbi:uncharacterized protein LOC142979713 [Anticarsia gemmatalis]|uniref:uncharacterized protein LOC142979713 n=1 Tax=Anticarsia gemmatalis TaxID=129554 RepID=UPI003F757CAE